MAEGRNPKDEPVRLVDENDQSLTFLNTHVDGREDTRPFEQNELEDGDDLVDPLDIEEEHLTDTDFMEETAADYATVDDVNDDRPLDREEDEEVSERGEMTAGRGIGTFALVLSILSLFFMPVLLGAAIIVGFVSRRYHAKTLGNWAIGIGAVAIVMTVFFSPFF